MPIDASIPLQAQGPQNPLEAYGRALALKNAIQQNQSGALQLQQQQQDIADQQKMRKAYMDSGGDLEKLQQNALQLGVGPNTLMKLKDQLLKQRETLASIDDKELSVKKAHTEAIGAAAQSLLQLPPEQRPAAYPQIIQTLIQEGRIKPGEVPPQYPGDEQIQLFANSARTSQQIIDSVLKEREVKAQEDRLKEEQAKNLSEKDAKWLNAAAGATSQQDLDSLRSQAKQGGASTGAIGRIPAMFSPDGLKSFGRTLMTQEQRVQADQAAANAGQTAQHNQVEEQQGAARIGISSAELNLRNKEYQQKYGDALGQMSPANRAIAEKVASGDFSPSQLGRLPGKEQILAGAIQLNPNWTQATYDAKQSFTNPEKTQAKNLGTISRIVGHIGRFEENSKKAGFSPLYAAGTNLTGAASVLSEDSHAIAAELEKLVSGGVGTQSQTEAWQKAFRSPVAAVRQKAVDEVSQLIGSQYEGMNQTYKAAVGSDLPVAKYVSPAGQQWLKSKGINVAGAAAGPQAATNSGSAPSITSQAEYDKLPKCAFYMEDGKKYRKP